MPPTTIFDAFDIAKKLCPEMQCVRSNRCYDSSGYYFEFVQRSMSGHYTVVISIHGKVIHFSRISPFNYHNELTVYYSIFFSIPFQIDQEFQLRSRQFYKKQQKRKLKFLVQKQRTQLMQKQMQMRRKNKPSRNWSSHQQKRSNKK
jgi:hypothetical protein